MRSAKKNKRSATTTSCSCCEQQTKKSRPTPVGPPTPIPLAVPSQEKGTSGPSNAHNNNTVQGGEVNPVPVPPNEVVLPIQQPQQQIPLNFADDSSSDDDVDPPAGLQDILNTQMIGFIPDTGMQYAEPVSTPIISQIKQSLCKDIWKGKYIDLSSHLPVNSASQPSNCTLQFDKHANISIQPSTRSAKITSIEG
ncbi:hypothetical protein DPMN_073907 [Dreissena polymorpha]|uniref:Uncharacterized protein n=1 Tax=Dreissena polymorpha TaxID=45954 RepID=A0A9D3YFA3_DREPO|nr:hypothetical protein DPMN_073907 [Dreissena polymorpha]